MTTQTQTTPRAKFFTPMVLLILCVTFGMLGVHRFCTKRYITGAIMLLLSFTGILVPVSSVWMIIDLIRIATKQPLAYAKVSKKRRPRANAKFSMKK